MGNARWRKRKGVGGQSMRRGRQRMRGVRMRRGVVGNEKEGETG